MRPEQTVPALAAFERRGAGTDAERRAAGWLAGQLEAGGRSAQLDPFWCRPNWALAHAWHVALGLAGSIVSVSSPQVGGAVILIALISLIADDVAGVSLGRRLTPERASQNVIGRAARTGAQHPIVRLIITANYDAGRLGLVYRPWLRRPAARLRGLIGPLAPGWLGWLAIALTWLLAIAILRAGGDRGSAIGAAQLVPTVALVLALALLIELGSSDYGPGASDNASGVAAALSLAAALDVAPPPRMSVELLLQGASDFSGTGFRRYRRANRRTLNANNTVVLGIAPCGCGDPRWWVSDGSLVPLRYLAALSKLAATLAAREPQLDLAGYRGRGVTPALAARAARLPAISIGCLDLHGLAPRSHQASDTTANLDPAALDGTVEFGLMLVDAIDGFLRERGNTSAAPDPVAAPAPAPTEG